MDNRKNNGGARMNAGRKELPLDERKITVGFQIKKKHIESAKAKIKPIIDKINKN